MFGSNDAGQLGLNTSHPALAPPSPRALCRTVLCGCRGPMSGKRNAGCVCELSLPASGGKRKPRPWGRRAAARTRRRPSSCRCPWTSPSRPCPGGLRHPPPRVNNRPQDGRGCPEALARPGVSPHVSASCVHTMAPACGAGAEPLRLRAQGVSLAGRTLLSRQAIRGEFWSANGQPWVESPGSRLVSLKSNLFILLFILIFNSLEKLRGASKPSSSTGCQTRFCRLRALLCSFHR